MTEFAGLGDGARRFVGLPKLSGEFCAGAGFDLMALIGW